MNTVGSPHDIACGTSLQSRITSDDYIYWARRRDEAAGCASFQVSFEATSKVHLSERRFFSHTLHIIVE